MNILTTIFVEAFADFDVSYTYATLVHPDIKDVEELKRLFCEKKGIPSFKGLPYNKLTSLTEEFVEFLKTEHGFIALTGTKVYFVD